MNIVHGDCLDVMRGMADASVDAIVTDPPYELGFMGKRWDGSGIAYNVEMWQEALRVLKPGGHLLAFGGTRTHHRMACAIEDAGFEIRDSMLYWGFGQGFPKSHNVTKTLQNQGKVCICEGSTLPYNHEHESPNTLSDLRAATTETTTEPTTEVLLAEMCGQGETHAAGHEGVRGVRQGVDTGEPISGGSREDVQPGVQSRTFEPEGEGASESARSARDGSVRGMRQAGQTIAQPHEAHHDADVFEPVQRDTARRGLEAARTQGPGSLDGGERTQLPREDERCEQPGVEGRRDVLPQARQLQADQVRPVSGGPVVDGAAGRLRDGAPAADGSDDGLSAATGGSGASHRPRPAEQCSRQPRIVARQPESQAGGAWPICDRCGLPVVPEGLGTALKPAYEPIVVARKPLGEKTVAANVLTHGTGAINIDGCRIATTDSLNGGAYAKNGSERTDEWGAHNGFRRNQGLEYEQPTGRWPANVILDEAAAAALDAQSGVSKSSDRPRHNGNFKSQSKGYEYAHTTYGHNDTGGASRYFKVVAQNEKAHVYADSMENSSPSTPNTGISASKDGHSTDVADRAISAGSLPINNGDAPASRFLYVPKASRRERNMGLPEGETSTHPTVKPLALMRYLVRLVTPPGGIVLDPFTGSGTTGCAAMLEGMQFIGIEQDTEYVEIARRRIAHVKARPMLPLGEAAD